MHVLVTGASSYVGSRAELPDVDQRIADERVTLDVLRSLLALAEATPTEAAEPAPNPQQL